MHRTTLLQRCQAGEAGAIQDLIKTHQQAVYRLALSILDDPAEADEATQDAFVTALSALHTFRGDSAFPTWLASITINLCRNRLRRRQARERLMRALQSLFRLAGASPTHPEEIIVQHESSSAVRKAVNSLGEKHRLPILLHYYHGYSVSEIAQALKISEGTALSRLYTARERLRLLLEGCQTELKKADEYERD